MTDRITEVQTKLRQLNEEMSEENIEVQSFYLEQDDDLEGTVAHIIFVVDGENVDYNLGQLDNYCEQAGKKLGDIVVFTYCIYRTHQEYNEDFDNEYWRYTLHEVNEIVYAA